MRVVIEHRRDSVCKCYVSCSSDLLCLSMREDLEKKDVMRVISL